MRQRHGRVFSRFFVGLVLAVALLAVSAGSAGAKNTKPKHNTCTGSTDNFPTELGSLSGSGLAWPDPFIGQLPSLPED